MLHPLLTLGLVVAALLLVAGLGALDDRRQRAQLAREAAERQARNDAALRGD